MIPRLRAPVVLLLVALSALAVACDDAERGFEELICVGSAKEMHGAVVSLDGKPVGRLDYLMLHDTWFDQLLKKLYPDSPAHDAVALNIAIRPDGLSKGEHEVSISKPGFADHVQTFTYPFEGPEETIYIVFAPQPLVRLQDGPK
jgi:hypothetical protein